MVYQSGHWLQSPDLKREKTCFRLKAATCGAVRFNTSEMPVFWLIRLRHTPPQQRHDMTLLCCVLLFFAFLDLFLVPCLRFAASHGSCEPLSGWSVHSERPMQSSRTNIVVRVPHQTPRFTTEFRTQTGRNQRPSSLGKVLS